MSKQWMITFENGTPSDEEKQKITATGMQMLQEHDQAHGFMVVGFGTEEQAEAVRKTTSATVAEDIQMSIC